MRKKIKLSNGFTLIELLIYMGLLTIFLSILTQIFASSLDVELESQSTSSVEQDGRLLMTRLMYDIHSGSAITVPASIGQSGNNLQITVNGINYSYGVNGNGDIQLTNNLGTDNLNSYDSKVTSIAFRRLGKINGKNAITINLTLTSRTTRIKGPETRNFQTTIDVR